MKGLSDTGPSLPALDSGQSGQVTPGHVSSELVSSAEGGPHNLVWDVALPLVIAIAVPLVLKRALESHRVRKMFRFPSPTQRPPEASHPPGFDPD